MSERDAVFQMELYAAHDKSRREDDERRDANRREREASDSSGWHAAWGRWVEHIRELPKGAKHAV